MSLSWKWAIVPPIFTGLDPRRRENRTIASSQPGSVSQWTNGRLSSSSQPCAARPAHPQTPDGDHEAKVSATTVVLGSLLSILCASCSAQPTSEHGLLPTSDAEASTRDVEASTRDAAAPSSCATPTPSGDTPCQEAGTIRVDDDAGSLYLCSSAGNWIEVGRAGPGFDDGGWQCSACSEGCSSTSPTPGSSCAQPSNQGCVYAWGATCAADWCYCESARWCCRYGDSCGDL
jgi:hypothetical protein